MSDFLILAFVILGAGLIAVPIASRLGLGSVLGYLIAGIAISPLLRFLNVDVIALQHFAEFGVVMMLFLIGLELEPSLLWKLRTKLLGLGGGQVLVTTILITIISVLLGEPFKIALAIGLVLALSSTAIVLQTLNERGLNRTEGGQSSFSVLLFQDIAVIPMLALMPLLAVPELQDVANHAAAGHGADAAADHGGGDHGTSGGISMVSDMGGIEATLVTIAAIVAVIFCGNFLTRPLFQFVAAAKLRELFTATALFIVIATALLMMVVGLSPALGAFMAGVVLATSEYRHEMESNIDPFRGLLLGLFFITVGAGIDFVLLMNDTLRVILLAIGLITIKGMVLFGLATVFKLAESDRWLFTLGLAQAGEFGFVLLSFGVANAILPQALADELLLVVTLTMLFTPAMFVLYSRVIAPMLQAVSDKPDDTIEEKQKVIIVGRGRVGGIVERMLKSASYDPVVIDHNSDHLDVLRRFGVHVYFGDATRPGLLHAAGVEEATLLVVAIDGKQQITQLVDYAVRTYPNLHVIARAVDRDHVYELWARGCRDIIRETYDSSLRMGRSAFEAMGISREAADEMTEAFNEMDRKAMIEVADSYDVDVPAHQNEKYISRVREMQGHWEAELRDRISKILDDKELEGA
ncbi:MAG: cation:proton antiporter [Pseudomonadota bacterium]